jgi:hypothetical protein
LLDVDSRLRVTRGIGKNETEASREVFQTLKERGHPEGPPPLITDGWGGIDDAILEVYGLIPEYRGRGRPPSRPQAGEDWLYLQMVKQRDEHGHLQGVKLKAVWGELDKLVELLGESTAYVERSNLTTRLFNARLTRKTWPSRKMSRCIEPQSSGRTATTTSFARTRACGPELLMILLGNGVRTLRQ